MRAKILLTAVALVAFSVTALAVPTATVTLESSKNGLTNVQPGTTVDWTIKVAVSQGDNQGLALISVDLEQDAGNASPFDLPPGDPASITGNMLEFSRPFGISNPGEGSFSTGYVGVQRGTSPGMNLKQIGGGLNTFGAAGTTIGTHYSVPTGVGQGAQPQVVLSGTFAAPSTAGTYTFRLTNGIANVIVQRNNPPAYSPVTAATVNLSGAVFSFAVQTAPPVCYGDCNCDATVGFSDIDLFVAGIPNNQANWAAKYQLYYGVTPPAGCWANTNVNGAGTHCGFDDIDPFVKLIPTPCTPRACCFADHTCQDLVPGHCLIAGGTFFPGPSGNKPCSQTTCP